MIKSNYYLLSCNNLELSGGAVMFDIRIYTFLTLYKEMNYRKTAELLSMTQPGVTQHIQHLEKQYGIKLFRYEGRTLYRTREAEIFKRHLDSMMAEEQAMRGEFVKDSGILLNIGATKTIGEFLLVPDVQKFLSVPTHSLNFVIDNTNALLQKLENNELDFAVIEGIIDKSRYGYHLYKKERFVGICSRMHHFANKTISLEEAFEETLLVREKGSGTRNLLEQAINDRGYSLDCFARTVSLNNFSVIMDLLVNNDAITFAYQPIAHQRRDLTTFEVQDMHIEGEFNFVYCNENIGQEKIRQFFE